ncbi:MAG: TFIIB-type zinc ribbon-containing protein [Lachnospiraceae bacterium]|nr:TFIIB-type zinc ribbon-containing protein [Lachnospiraceae bacterium]
MNFDDITARVKKISKDTVAEVQKMNEVRQLNACINAEKKKVHSTYMEMGKKLYDRYREEPLEGLETEFHSLENAFASIETLQEQIRAVKGVTLCPNCKTEVGVLERFCSNCGSKMPEVFEIIDDDPEKITPEETAGMPESAEEEEMAGMSEATEEEEAAGM